MQISYVCALFLWNRNNPSSLAYGRYSWYSFGYSHVSENSVFDRGCVSYE